ncbi:hypothetical protein [Rossellomorea marisflavi]|uniref:hypothetical protein n=1 Tax=Rossellomorea marisflavi TaxID=189381 RepID=UPI003FA087D2
MVKDVIEKLKLMDLEIKELKRGKKQSEALLAAVMEKVGEVEITFQDIYNSDSEKVKIKNNVPEDPSKLTLYYELNKN